MRRKESVSAAGCTYTVLLQPEPEGGYNRDLSGAAGPGHIWPDPGRSAGDGGRRDPGYIECLRKDGEPIPASDPPRRPWLSG